MQIICALELQHYRYIAIYNCNSLSCGKFCTVQGINSKKFSYLRILGYGFQ